MLDQWPQLGVRRRGGDGDGGFLTSLARDALGVIDIEPGAAGDETGQSSAKA